MNVNYKKGETRNPGGSWEYKSVRKIEIPAQVVHTSGETRDRNEQGQRLYVTDDVLQR